MPLPYVTAQGDLGQDPELRYTQAGKPWTRLRLACAERRNNQAGDWKEGPPARPWAACLHAGMMRVYLRTVPWVWLATATAGAFTWQATVDRAEDWASLPAPVSAGQEGCVPQSSPNREVSE